MALGDQAACDFYELLLVVGAESKGNVHVDHVPVAAQKRRDGPLTGLAR